MTLALAHVPYAEPSAGRPQPSERGRLGLVDVARGVAVVAMVVYHSAWDLSELRLIETDIRADFGWSLFARAIAAGFLVLVGVGLVLAHGRSLRPRAFLRRLAIVAGAALAVTVATYWVFPNSYVFYGILHAIALSSVLALPFLRLPVWVAIAAAVLCFAAPLLVAGPAFDARPLTFLGLATRVPNTNDFVPVFPWFGFVLAGIAAMRLGWPALARLPERTERYPGALRGLAWVGRHSLLIYLLHQPLLFGAMTAWVEIVGRSPAAEAAPFLQRCAASCRSEGQNPALCQATCACTIEALKGADLWAGVVQDRLPPDQRLRIGALARQCFERSRQDDHVGRP